ncbi:hypothetical protein CYMTET_31081 [Cymbomonas tetramitiformis]|uniref:Odorant receptor n=1 Tax=Cymbomonas tetramitiformis TaxID=36881 RepID=A0AAE0KT93_9CHLO|nr:hypothetical protein CYMTET_31081 [Cymbomonas tetramitiformis]
MGIRLAAPPYIDPNVMMLALLNLFNILVLANVEAVEEEYGTDFIIQMGILDAFFFFRVSLIGVKYGQLPKEEYEAFFTLNQADAKYLRESLEIRTWLSPALPLRMESTMQAEVRAATPLARQMPVRFDVRHVEWWKIFLGPSLQNQMKKGSDEGDDDDIVFDETAGLVSVRAICVALIESCCEETAQSVTMDRLAVNMISMMMGLYPVLQRAVFQEYVEDYGDYTPPRSIFSTKSPILIILPIMQILLFLYYTMIIVNFMMVAINDMKRRFLFNKKLGDMLNVPTVTEDGASASTVAPPLDVTHCDSVLGWIACRRILQGWKKELQTRLQLSLVLAWLLTFALILHCAITVLGERLIPASQLLLVMLIMMCSLGLMSLAILYGHFANGQAREYEAKLIRQAERMQRLSLIPGVAERFTSQLQSTEEALTKAREFVMVLDRDHPITLFGNQLCRNVSSAFSLE